MDESLNSLKIKALGAGQEVGRSCVLIQFRGRSILFDCGIHPGKNGRDSLPLLDDIRDVKLDCVLITHFHSDHCAALPYLITRTTLGRSQPKIFMTQPTRTLYEYVTKDFIRKAMRGNFGAAAAARSGIDLSSTEAFGNESGSIGSQLYEEADIDRTNALIEVIGFDETKEYRGIRITCLNAGHVLGACMFLVEIDEKRVLYTGDFSCQEDHHLMGAKVPAVPSVDVLIVESTYGINNHDPREKREKDFLTAVRSCIDRGGKCLIPMFALGRAQELMLILEEHWAQHPELADVPLWFCSSMAGKYLDVYQRSIGFMNDRVKGATANPFEFPHFSKRIFDLAATTKPCVVIAGPGMLQNGMSRRIFEHWCEDERNTVLIAGYCIEGTLGSDIQKNPREVTAMDKRKLKLKASVVTISFSAHTDFNQTNGFIQRVSPNHIYLVHGERTNVKKLHDELRKLYANLTVYYLVNGRDFSNRLSSTREVSIVGSLALPPQPQSLQPSTSSASASATTTVTTPTTTTTVTIPGKRLLSGIFIENGGIKFISPADISAYTPAKVARVHQRQSLSFHASLGALRSVAAPLCDDTVLAEDGSSLVLDAGRVTIRRSSPSSISLEWNSSAVTDMLVDSILALAFRLDSNPLLAAKVEDANAAAADAATSGTSGAAEQSQFQDSLLKTLMKAKFILKKHFGNATVVDGSKVRIDFDYPAEYALVSVPSFVNKQANCVHRKNIILLVFYFFLLYLGS